MNKKTTKHINIFGGPGIGKSATAMGLTKLLKKNNVSCQYVPEVAKDLTMEEHNVALLCQPLIAGKQIFRQYKLEGKTDFVITDSPLLINLLHDGFGVTDNYKKWLVEVFNMFDNFNILLITDRDARPYETEGRAESKERATEMDKENYDILVQNNLSFIEVEISDKTEEDAEYIIYKTLIDKGFI